MRYSRIQNPGKLGGMEEQLRPPLAWEEKGALVCLVFLSMQAIYEGVRYCTGNVFPASGKIHSVSILLLGIYFVLGLGLFRQNKLAWWFGIVVVPLFGVLLTRHTWMVIGSFIQTRLRGESYFGRDSMNDDFEILWLIARNVFLLAIPLLLLLGQFRRSLQKR